MARWGERPKPAQAVPLLSARALRGVSCLLLTCCAGPLTAAESSPYFLRNHNPFLQGFGLPALEGGLLTPSATLDARVAISLANHADHVSKADEAVTLDGESYYVDAIFRYGLGKRWEVGVDLPYVSHRRGRLDNLIEGWHDLFGLDNSERSGPSNHLELTYRRGNTTHVDVRDAGGGAGDIRLMGAYQLLESPDRSRAVALRGVVKLPTGEEERLRGSGATDLAVSLETTAYTTLAGRALELSGQIGAMHLGEGDLLADEQKTTVPFGGIGAMWRWNNTVDLRVQLAVQGEYFDSRLDPIGGSTASVALGGAFHLRRLGVDLDVALVEDLISDSTPDFGLYVSVSRTMPPGKGRRKTDAGSR